MDFLKSIKKKFFFINLFIFLTSVSLPIIIADQFLKFNGHPKNNGRLMLLSGGELKNSKDGIKQYSPNSTIRHSAVYGKKIVYSYYFDTDKYGFRITNE